MKFYRFLIVIGLLFIATALVVGVRAQEPSPDDPIGPPPVFLRGIFDAWAASPHADVTAEAFIHWNEEEEKVVPVDCAKCHSTPGYQDFLGADGSAAGAVDTPAALGSVINCDACHNQVSSNLTSVTFPSGVEVTNLSDAARCMVCHQGRASSVTVNDAIAAAGMAEDLDTVSPDLRFINIHYYAAAASLYGAEVHGGYEYEGNSYQVRNDHVEGYDTCIDCHSPHTLEVQVETCATCHEGVESVEDLRNVRMNGSLSDYDGDGDIEEGIAAEITTLQEMLYQAMQSYASDVAGTALVYDAARYPYFFADANANSAVDEGEEAFASWTARLLQAAYNYQVTLKDPGAFAHNPKYHIELLYDAIESLNSGIAEQVDLSQTTRNDPGHFDATGEPFRHWDAEGEVPGTCARCHTAGGLPTYLKNGANIAAEPSSSLQCSTCHDAIPEFTMRVSNEVTFPSGAKASFGEEEPANLCLNCHQGRESTVSVNRSITAAGVGDDEVSDKLNFRNVHYFAAGASLFGGEVQGAYQYEGAEYNGHNEHTRSMNECTDCHTEHSLEVRVEECIECHESIEDTGDVRLIRADPDDKDPVDYDGDGNTEEPVADELASLQDALMAAIQSYAAGTAGTAIAYSPSAYPYWFADTNGNGEADADEAIPDNGYKSWTPNLLRAAYDYQYSVKDPGVFAHNPDYIIQVLYDSIQAVGGDEAVASFNRPPVRVEE